MVADPLEFVLVEGRLFATDAETLEGDTLTGGITGGTDITTLNGDGHKIDGGSFDIEPGDFAGSFVSDDGADNIAVNLGAFLSGDGSDNIAVNLGAFLSGDGSDNIQVNLGSFLSGDGSDNIEVNLATSGGLKGDGSDNITVEPADFAGTFLSDDGADNLQVDTGAGLEGDGAGNVRVEEPFVYDPGMVEWADGLSNEEVARIDLQAGETLVVERIEFRQKGGGSSTSASVDVRDTGAASTIGSQNLGGTTKDPGSSNSGNTVIVRVSNSTGGAINANPRITGFIEGS